MPQGLTINLGRIKIKENGLDFVVPHKYTEKLLVTKDPWDQQWTPPTKPWGSIMNPSVTKKVTPKIIW